MNEDDRNEMIATLNEMRKLKREIDATINLFSNRVTINKMLELIGTGKLKLRNLSANPPTGTVGELVVVGGKLKICTAATPTWTVVGAQTA